MPFNACCCGGNNTNPCKRGCCQIAAMTVLEGGSGFAFDQSNATLSSFVQAVSALFTCPGPGDSNLGTGIFKDTIWKWNTLSPSGSATTHAYLPGSPICPTMDPDSNTASSWTASPETLNTITSVRCCAGVPADPATTGTLTFSNIIGTLNSTNTTAMPVSPVWSSGQMVYSVVAAGWVPLETAPSGGFVAIKAADSHFIDFAALAVTFGEYKPGGGSSGCLLNSFVSSGGLVLVYNRIGGSSRIGALGLYSAQNLTGAPLYIGMGF